MREKFVIVGARLIPWQEAAVARLAYIEATQSSLSAPMVIRDALGDVVNPCDGRPYDSKRAYYRAVKDAGCVIAGNEAETLAESVSWKRPGGIKEDIISAMKKLDQGYKPAPLESLNADQ